MKWRGVPLAELDDTGLLDAMRQTIRISGELWKEVCKRKLVRDV